MKDRRCFCMYFLSVVFLCDARRLELSPCNTYAARVLVSLSRMNSTCAYLTAMWTLCSSLALGYRDKDAFACWCLGTKIQYRRAAQCTLSLPVGGKIIPAPFMIAVHGRFNVVVVWFQSYEKLLCAACPTCARQFVIKQPVMMPSPCNRQLITGGKGTKLLQGH